VVALTGVCTQDCDSDEDEDVSYEELVSTYKEVPSGKTKSVGYNYSTLNQYQQSQEIHAC
jgi:hypothetical protein